MARIYYNAVFSGHGGRMRPDPIQVMQNAIETDLVFDCFFEDGEDYTFVGDEVITCYFRDVDDAADYQSGGTFTAGVGTNQFTWARDASDVGTPSLYKLTFKVVPASGDPDLSIVAEYRVDEVPDGTDTPLPPPNVGVTPAEKAWLEVQTANGENVASKTDKIIPAVVGDFAGLDAAGNLTDSGSAAADFEPALPAVGGDGWVLSSTIAGVRSWIAQASGAAWGAITGTLADQADLQNALDAKVDLAGDDMTGGLSIAVPTATENALVLQTTDDDDTNNALEVQDSAGAALMSVGAEGNGEFRSKMDIVAGNGSILRLSEGGTTASIESLNNQLNIISNTNIRFTATASPGGDIYFDASDFLKFRNASVDVMWIENELVGVGVSATPNAQLEIVAKNAATIGQIIQLAAGATANALEVQTSAAAVVASVDASGGALFDTLKITNIKSGATQGAAGAAADEVWKTASHATLPDNVLLIGV